MILLEIQLSSSIKEEIPDFKIGVIHYNNIEVSDSPQMIKGRLRLFQESIYLDLDEKPLTEIAGISEWRKVFKKVGTDPNRYRPSVEALYRRISKQNYLDTIHSAADINNFFSLQYQVPIGIYDVDKLKGAIQIRVGNNDDYTGINGRDIQMKNKILTSDELGPFGSPYVDSERSAVTLKTKNAIQFIYLQPSMEINQANKLVHSLRDMFVQIHGGTAHDSIIK